MTSDKSVQNDLNQRFKEKLNDLKFTLPPLGKNKGHSCAATTLTNILDVLDLSDLKLNYFYNLAIPFSGFASFNSYKGWKGPCGAVFGGIAAIGIIMGGIEKTKDFEVPIVYGKAIRFASKFEEKFGSLCCQDLCGYDLKHNLKDYVKDRIWENKCCNLVLFTIDQVSKLMRKELKSKWTDG
ncbi:MAG: C-GCAxxG-C-C family protein [Candidatus Lokiarchaeota archaeon]